MDPQKAQDTQINSPPKPSQLPILTKHDTQILHQLLSPGLAPVPPITNLIDPGLPPPASSLLALEASILAPLNTACPSASTLRTAIDALSALIIQHPNHASAYNNRAQATRLLLGDDLRVNEAVWTDLGTAIALLGGTKASSSSSSSNLETSSTSQVVVVVVVVSKHNASVLSKAYTQRAWMLWKLAKSSPAKGTTEDSTNSPFFAEQRDFDFPKADSEDNIITPSSKSSFTEQQNLPAQLRGLSRNDLEELASRDFTMGGRYGDESARGMAVRTSPYAKLCGQIVQEAMKGDFVGGWPRSHVSVCP